MRNSDGDINGANTIRFEKKLLGGERRGEERAVQCEGAGGELHGRSPPWRAQPPPTRHALLVLSVSVLCDSSVGSVQEIAGDKEWLCYLPGPVCLHTSVYAIEVHRLSELLTAGRAPAAAGGCPHLVLPPSRGSLQGLALQRAPCLRVWVG